MNIEFTVFDFHRLLTTAFNIEITPHSAHIRGWFEDDDELHGEIRPLDKRTAARIVHQFMKIELGIKDLKDITAALYLKDIYTCHVCTNHIAQVYTRGLMPAEEIEGYLFFNHLKLLYYADAVKIISKLSELSKSEGI